jgi:hypothetical protein
LARDTVATARGGDQTAEAGQEEYVQIRTSGPESAIQWLQARNRSGTLITPRFAGPGWRPQASLLDLTQGAPLIHDPRAA